MHVDVALYTQIMQHPTFFCQNCISWYSHGPIQPAECRTATFHTPARGNPISVLSTLGNHGFYPVYIRVSLLVWHRFSKQGYFARYNLIAWVSGCWVYLHRVVRPRRINQINVKKLVVRQKISFFEFGSIRLLL